MLATPPAGPLGSFPVQTLRPAARSASATRTGDIAASAIGTVAYVDGDRVWGFGHPLDGVGARSLLLQDAYVFRVINNPDRDRSTRSAPTSTPPPGTTSAR